MSEKTTSGNTVFVFANLPHGQSFDLIKNGKKERVTINGYPVSRLCGEHGEILPGGKYGVTQIKADLWEAIQKTFGSLRIFTSGAVFAAASVKEGEAKIASELSGVRHGLEPVDTTKTVTRKKKG